MKKKYEFPVYSPVVPPQVAFQLVYADGSKSMSFTPDRWEAETYHNTQKVVGWVPARAEITVTPEDGKWYLCELPGGTQAVLYRSEGAWRTKSVHPFITYADKALKVIAEMREVER